MEYLAEQGSDIKVRDNFAIKTASTLGHLNIVKYLVEHEADIEISNRHGHTCLMIACYKGHYQIAKYLISKSADLNRKSIKGNTALHDCAECGSLEIMKLFITKIQMILEAS